MPTPLASLASLLAAVAILEIGGGLLGLAVPIRASIAGFSTVAIGLLGTAYYLGFVLGCLGIPRVVSRVGHIRAFSAFAAISASSALMHALVVDVSAWIMLRLLLGVSFAGIYMVIESWLNDVATSTSRGGILAAYMIVGWAAVIVGKVIYVPMDPAGFTVFAVVCIAMALSLVPIALTTGLAPRLNPPSHVPIGDLFRVSPVGVLGCLGAGMANSAFWSLSPIFAADLGGGSVAVSAFVSVIIVGGALGQWPLGRLSDRIDRRKVIVAACFAASAAGLAMAASTQWTFAVTLAAALVFGLFALPVYSLCNAHVNDLVSRESLVEVNSGLLLLFGIGAILGPFVGSLAMGALGPFGLFCYTAAIHALLGVFALARIRRRAPTPPDERAPFVPVPRTSPGVIEVNPPAGDTQE